MNVLAAARADASALGKGASPEEPTSSPPESGVSETAAAASAISEEVSPEELDHGTSSSIPPALQAALDHSRARRARKALEAASNLTSQSEAQEVMLANLSSFTRHDSFYELCGLLGTKDIERSAFDALCSKGMSEASGALGNLDKTLGEQAGASLGVSLDPIFREKGMAILKKCPAAAGWKGGENSWGYCAPHPDYHVLKRARLTTEDSAQP